MINGSPTNLDTPQIDYLYDEDNIPYAAVYRSPASSATPTVFGMVTSDRGDVLELLDTNGNPFACYHYDAWGNPVGGANDQWGKPTGVTTASTSLITSQLAIDIANRQVLRCAGYAYDPESYLYYCSARFYDPASRQFTTADGAKADGEESTYQYCDGDPVEFSDPTGEMKTFKTGNWCGYVMTDKRLRGVRGQFTVRRCTTAISKAHDVEWIAMGGAAKGGITNTGLLQTGIDMSHTPPKPWWEYITTDQPWVWIGHTAHGGDHIWVTVRQHSDSNHTWYVLKIQDLTRNHRWSTTKTRTKWDPGHTADWILETGVGGAMRKGKFGTVKFSRCSWYGTDLKWRKMTNTSYGSGTLWKTVDYGPNWKWDPPLKPSTITNGTTFTVTNN